mmetsp:Transcript_118573/g.340460  ORF Transcript_118573/g.340460 Transcript_118573/m.340460 type:complete len:289 (+) Transcript_118573:291-1157(+)
MDAADEGTVTSPDKRTRESKGVEELGEEAAEAPAPRAGPGASVGGSLRSNRACTTAQYAAGAVRKSGAHGRTLGGAAVTGGATGGGQASGAPATADGDKAMSGCVAPVVDDWAAPAFAAAIALAAASCGVDGIAAELARRSAANRPCNLVQKAAGSMRKSPRATTTLGASPCKGIEKRPWILAQESAEATRKSGGENRGPHGAAPKMGLSSRSSGRATRRSPNIAWMSLTDDAPRIGKASLGPDNGGTGSPRLAGPSSPAMAKASSALSPSAARTASARVVFNSAERR